MHKWANGLHGRILLIINLKGSGPSAYGAAPGLENSLRSIILLRPAKQRILIHEISHCVRQISGPIADPNREPTKKGLRLFTVTP